MLSLAKFSFFDINFLMLKRLLQIVAVLGTGIYLYLRPDPNVPSTPPKTVAKVDIEKYGGTWYEIASIPMFFQRGCVNTKATYSLLEDKTVKVENYCYSNGKKYEVVGTAVPEDDTGAKLKVSFPMTLGISSPYWVVRLGKDYEYSVVTQPGYQYLWILYRESTMPEDLYNSLIESISKDGYPVDRIVRTPQNQPEPSDEKGFGL